VPYRGEEPRLRFHRVRDAVIAGRVKLRHGPTNSQFGSCQQREFGEMK
jgi:hypothetical protein